MTGDCAVASVAAIAFASSTLVEVWAGNSYVAVNAEAVDAELQPANGSLGDDHLMSES